MPLARGADSYADVRALLDRALESEKGIVVTFEDEKVALSKWRICYVVRSRAAKQSMKMFPADDPKYGCSPYDKLQFRHKGNKLEILKLSSLNYAIEEVK